MNTRQTQARVASELKLNLIAKLTLNTVGYTHVTDLIIRESKYFIMMYKSGVIVLFNSWSGECYGEITLSHAKRLIKINNNRNN